MAVESHTDRGPTHSHAETTHNATNTTDSAWGQDSETQGDCSLNNASAVIHHHTALSEWMGTQTSDEGHEIS